MPSHPERSFKAHSAPPIGEKASAQPLLNPLPLTPSYPPKMGPAFTFVFTFMTRSPSMHSVVALIVPELFYLRVNLSSA